MPTANNSITVTTLSAQWQCKFILPWTIHYLLM